VEETPAERKSRKKKEKKQAEKDKRKFYDEQFPPEDRPETMRPWKAIKNYSIDKLLRVKKSLQSTDERKNLGEEAAAKDAKAKKTEYKKATDDGINKLHPARWNRQPLAPPKEFYDQIPKKHDAIVRNFPTEHLGITGQVPDTTIGHMHNRAVKVTLESFCRPTFKAAKGAEKGGKYCDRTQLEDGVLNYCMMLHSLWPADYSGLVITKVLVGAKWGELAGLTGR